MQVEQQLLKAEGANEAFRLWITAEPHPSFPIGLLHMGLKVTNEAPVGIKAGLKASYQWVSQVDSNLPHHAADLYHWLSAAYPLAGLPSRSFSDLNSAFPKLKMLLKKKPQQLNLISGKRHKSLDDRFLLDLKLPASHLERARKL